MQQSQMHFIDIFLLKKVIKNCLGVTRFTTMLLQVFCCKKLDKKEISYDVGIFFFNLQAIVQVPKNLNNNNRVGAKIGRIKIHIFLY